MIHMSSSASRWCALCHLRDTRAAGGPCYPRHLLWAKISSFKCQLGMAICMDRYGCTQATTCYESTTTRPAPFASHPVPLASYKQSFKLYPFTYKI